MEKKKYDVAAYIWPAYTGDEPRTRIFWPNGIGEWETVQVAKSQFEGHLWPRKPLWGYVNEADPEVMEKQIDEAVNHGVNVFIYDWYWFDNRPFLEQCLNDGFLKAKNHKKMKFYVMWANHDANYVWDKRLAETDESTKVWLGSADRPKFETIAKRLIKQYFCLDEYYKIDGKPLFSIYDIGNFVKGLGGIEQTKEAMEWMQEEAKKAGLKGIHFQIIKISDSEMNYTGVDGGDGKLSGKEVVRALPFDSITHYQYIHAVFTGREYNEVTDEFFSIAENMQEEYGIPYYPHVSVGWDNTPRNRKNTFLVIKNNTPENFERACEKAKALADKLNVNLITVNSWNEWTETSYLEPDDLYGYGYLDAIKKVFGA